MKARVIAYGLAVGIFLLVTGVAFLPTGRATATYSLNGFHPRISRFFPVGRLSEPERLATGGWQQRVLAEPVYVTVLAPRRMEQISLRFLYRAENIPALRLGVLLTPAASAPPSAYKFYDMNPRSTDGEWSVYEQDVNVDNAALMAGQYRFILSAAELGPDSLLTLHRLDVSLRGQALTPAVVSEKVWKMATSLWAN